MMGSGDISEQRSLWTQTLNTTKASNQQPNLFKINKNTKKVYIKKKKLFNPAPAKQVNEQ